MGEFKLSKNWHLAETDDEVQISEFELLLWRVFNGFVRWHEDCETAVNNVELGANELAILHIIRMKERPKTIYEIAHLLNRTDFPNIQYSIKKLLKLDFIAKTDSPNKAISYKITEKGISDTSAYSQARKEVLVKLFPLVKDDSETNLKDVSKYMLKLVQVYDEASRMVMSYQDYSAPETD